MFTGDTQTLLIVLCHFGYSVFTGIIVTHRDKLNV